MLSMKCGGQVQGTPDGWVWRWHEGTPYGMFLRLLGLPGTEQLLSGHSMCMQPAPCLCFTLDLQVVPDFSLPLLAWSHLFGV